MSFHFTDELDQRVHEHAEEHCRQQLGQPHPPAERAFWERVRQIVTNPQAIASSSFNPKRGEEG